MFKTLILLESNRLAYSLDLIGLAEEMAGKRESAIYGLGINLTEELTNSGLDYLIQVDDPTIKLYDGRTVAKLVADLQAIHHFDSVLVLATSIGRMIAPRISMALKTGLVADITSIAVKEGEIQLIRPAFSGNVLANIICDTEPIMASVHPNVFHRQESIKSPEVLPFLFMRKTEDGVTIEEVISNQGTTDIQDSQILVAFGGGYNGQLEQVTELASRLEGTVASSKTPVDAGIAPRSIQVGQSGKTVSPKLYVALGISGAIHHVEGLKNVETIISINKSKTAPLNFLADIVVIGDAVVFLEKLKKRMKEG